MGFVKCTVEHGLYVKQEGAGDITIICLYVDDLLITGSDVKLIDRVKKQLSQEFEMTDLGLLTYFLGIEFLRTECGTFMLQR